MENENENQNQEEMTPEEKIYRDSMAKSEPLLQQMADFATKGKFQDYFRCHADLMELWAVEIPSEEEGEDPHKVYVAPWQIPVEIQLIMIHTNLSLQMRILMQSGVLQAAAMQAAAAKSSLVRPDGSPIITEK